MEPRPNDNQIPHRLPPPPTPRGLRPSRRRHRRPNAHVLGPCVREDFSARRCWCLRRKVAVWRDGGIAEVMAYPIGSIGLDILAYIFWLIFVGHLGKYTSTIHDIHGSYGLWNNHKKWQRVKPLFHNQRQAKEEPETSFFPLVFIPNEDTRRESENVPIEKNNQTSAWPIHGMVMHAMN